MTNSPYLLFNQTPEQLRRIGARGGKATARNRRAQGQLPAEAPAAVILHQAQTSAQAIAELDVQFPWLSDAERRKANGRARRSKSAW